MRYLKSLLLACSVLFTSQLQAATHRTDNFIVHAQSATTARSVAERAEKYRDQLAEYWIGDKMPQWWRPCVIHVKHGPTSGSTQFAFHEREVFGWKMEVQGNSQTLMVDSLPHEVSHTILATVFRRPLPRWVDEGACQTVESDASRHKMRQVLRQNWQYRYRFPELFSIKQYPRDGTRLATLYAQGHSVTEFLLACEGPATLMSFIEAGKRDGWDHAVQTHYGHSGVSALENAWIQWWTAGMPAVKSRTDQFMAYRMTPNGPRTYSPSQTPKVRPIASQGTTGDYQVCVFTSPNCQPCEQLKIHYRQGKFGDKRFRFVDFNSQYRRAFENQTGARLSHAPTVWIVGTKNYRVGYNGYYPGLLQWIIGFLVGTPPFGFPPAQQQSPGSDLTLQDVQNYLVSNGYIRRSDVDAYLKREDVQRFITEQGLLTIDQFESVKKSLATSEQVQQAVSSAVETAVEKTDTRTKLLETALKAVDDKIKLNNEALDERIKLDELGGLLIQLLNGNMRLRDIIAELAKAGVLDVLEEKLGVEIDDRVSKSAVVKSVVSSAVTNAVAEKAGGLGVGAAASLLGIGGPIGLGLGVGLPLAGKLARRRIKRRFDGSGNVVEETEA